MTKTIISLPRELNLNQKLSLIQKEFKANKSKFNSFGKYNFRSAEDILEALKPFNEKYDVSFVIREELINFWNDNQLPIIKSTATIYDNNGVNKIQANAIVGVDLNQKGMQVPQQFGSASSYAKKYALGNLLLIDDTQDADATNKHDNQSKEVTTEVELKWLNKNTPEFNKAIEYLKAGGSIATIENKYKLAKTVKDELLKVK
jgi:wyosine [tRNA(Phe)-imidazoG37] synthetase (radical SAM superfamily)